LFAASVAVLAALWQPQSVALSSHVREFVQLTCLCASFCWQGLARHFASIVGWQGLARHFACIVGKLII
jgi:hypothetical protein